MKNTSLDSELNNLQKRRHPDLNESSGYNSKKLKLNKSNNTVVPRIGDRFFIEHPDETRKIVYMMTPKTFSSFLTSNRLICSSLAHFSYIFSYSKQKLVDLGLYPEVAKKILKKMERSLYKEDDNVIDYKKVFNFLKLGKCVKFLKKMEDFLGGFDSKRIYMENLEIAVEFSMIPTIDKVYQCCVVDANENDSRVEDFFNCFYILREKFVDFNIKCGYTRNIFFMERCILLAGPICVKHVYLSYNDWKRKDLINMLRFSVDQGLYEIFVVLEQFIQKHKDNENTMKELFVYCIKGHMDEVCLIAGYLADKYNFKRETFPDHNLLKYAFLDNPDPKKIKFLIKKFDYGRNDILINDFLNARTEGLGLLNTVIHMKDLDTISVFFDTCNFTKEEIPDVFYPLLVEAAMCNENVYFLIKKKISKFRVFCKYTLKIKYNIVYRSCLQQEFDKEFTESLINDFGINDIPFHALLKNDFLNGFYLDFYPKGFKYFFKRFPSFSNSIDKFIDLLCSNFHVNLGPDSSVNKLLIKLIKRSKKFNYEYLDKLIENMHYRPWVFTGMKFLIENIDYGDLSYILDKWVPNFISLKEFGNALNVYYFYLRRSFDVNPDKNDFERELQSGFLDYVSKNCPDFRNVNSCNLFQGLNYFILDDIFKLSYEVIYNRSIKIIIDKEEKTDLLGHGYCQQ